MPKRLPNELQKILDRAAGPGVPLMAKPMFGGIGYYADSRIFAIIWDGGIALKLLGDDFAAFGAAGGKPVQFMPDKPVSKSYIRVPDKMIDDAATLADWTGRAVRAALDAPAKLPKPARRRR
jgi:TfoX/Sxy family transcriptional regulator of competence genes